MVELMVSITMLAIILLGIATLFPRGMGFSTQSRLMAKASSLAQAKAEEFERLATLHPDLTAGTHTEAVENFTRTWVITDNTPMRKVKRARIGVTWTTANSIDSVGTTVYLFKP
jgi:Tfp pilus assembly protein PilV